MSDIHRMPDMRLNGIFQLIFYPVDSSSPCMGTIEVTPGPVPNTFWMRVLHDNNPIREVLVKLPNYQPGDEVQL